MRQFVFALASTMALVATVACGEGASSLDGSAGSVSGMLPAGPNAPTGAGATLVGVDDTSAPPAGPGGLPGTGEVVVAPAGSSVGGAGGDPGAASGVTGANLDDGNLFPEASVVALGDTSALPDDGSAVAAPDDRQATLSIASVGLTATFTQIGIDVTVVLTATQCAAGTHVIQIRDGFTCDSSVRGGVWDGLRGGGIGGPDSSITCDAARQGTLTYTRSGSDPATNWSVGDLNPETDVTLHPMTFDNACGTF